MAVKTSPALSIVNANATRSNAVVSVTGAISNSCNNNAVGVEFNQRQMINNHEESEHEEEEEDNDEMEDFIEMTA